MLPPGIPLLQSTPVAPPSPSLPSEGLFPGREGGSSEVGKRGLLKVGGSRSERGGEPSFPWESLENPLTSQALASSTHPAFSRGPPPPAVQPMRSRPPSPAKCVSPSPPQLGLGCLALDKGALYGGWWGAGETPVCAA